MNSAKLPEITLGSGNQNTSNQKRANIEDRLPDITPRRDVSNSSNDNNVLTHNASVRKEHTVIVGTSDSSNYSPPIKSSYSNANNELPQEWRKQRVNEDVSIKDQQDIQMTKLEWENQIAKHILSLYATSNVAKHKSNGQSMLDFVDKQNKTNVEAITEIKAMRDSAHIALTSNSHNTTHNNNDNTQGSYENNEENDNDNYQSNYGNKYDNTDENYDDNNNEYTTYNHQIKKKLKKKKKSSKKTTKHYRS